MSKRPSRHRRRRQIRLVGALAILVAALISAAVYRSVSQPDLQGISTPTTFRTAASAPPTSPPASRLTAARKVLQGPATISVIGDSTGNDGDEWVSLWAADLGQDRTVRLERWLAGRYRRDPFVIGAQGDTITIWNASEPGAAVGWATSRIVDIEPERPDLVIINFGHNNTESNMAPQLDGLLEKLDRAVPVVLILQNPGLGAHEEPQAATLRSAQRWADAHKVPTIDVTSAFTDPASQMRDDFHPNEAGSQAWAKVVAKALGA